MRRMLFFVALLALMGLAIQRLADAWTEMYPPDPPEPRCLHAMAYDSESDRLVLFGGNEDGGDAARSDTWLYDRDTDTWTEVTPAASPPGRRGHAMAYDAESDRIILFGGSHTGGGYDRLEDTWAYDCNTNTWEEMNPAVGPGGRYQHAMAYDAHSDRVILFGGDEYGGVNYRDETWAYDYNTDTWQQMDPAVHPSERVHIEIAYDEGSDRIVLFGGYGPGNLDDTWTYDYDTDTWERMNPGAHPSARHGNGIAYDAQADRVVLFGGYSGGEVGDTWVYDCDSDAWSEITPAVHPPSREYSAMAYDAESGCTILFGGRDTPGPDMNDTWSFRLAVSDVWTEMDPPDPPHVRGHHAVAYDAESDVVILFGGYIAENQRADDTWAYDYNTDTWMELFPEISPSARIAHAMAYDAESDRVILFGGIQDGDDKMGDTWAYDHNTNTWAEMNPPTHPDDRYGFAFAYDAESDLIVLHGGRGQPYVNLDDTWWYDYNTNTWHGPFYPDPRPTPRRNLPMAYDAESDRCILFGGEDDLGHPMPGTWAYDQNTNSWDDMNPPNPPEDRCLHSMAYHAEIDRVILFGGAMVGGCLDDTWAYDHNSNTWGEIAADIHPTARICYQDMTYDAESSRIILFGGDEGGEAFVDDTWSFTTTLFYKPPEGWLWYGRNWVAIPAVPHDPNPEDVLGFDCGGVLWNWDKYRKSAQVYRPPFVSFDMMVGESYLLWLDEVPDSVSYLGTAPETPFAFKLGRTGWTWLGKPGVQELSGSEFMDTVMVEYPTGSGDFRSAREDHDATPNNWLSWDWAWWDAYAQAPRAFTPYLPWYNTCYPWLGYRCWVNVGTAQSPDDPDQVTLIWP